MKLLFKTYFQYMNEITSDELYKGLLAHGLFSEKIPPFLTSESFYEYCRQMEDSFKYKPHKYIYFESMRNINIPRPIGIPVPMAYELLCRHIRDNWDKIKQHIEIQVKNQTHKISRLHIRKMVNNPAIFKMNYENWWNDGAPKWDLPLGARYVVTADIATCFSRIYTHSICWALKGKCEAKKEHRDGWENELDKLLRGINDNETYGLLIGPHVSNLISEIILTVIDKKLFEKGLRFIRNIDDYTCYVSKQEDAERFLCDLQCELRIFNLSLNHKKTKIIALPISSNEEWTRKLNAFVLINPNESKVNFRFAQAFLDCAVDLMKKNDNNSAILNYAIKKLSGFSLTKNARVYSIKTFLHYCFIYPYLIPLLEKYLFNPFNADVEEIKNFSDRIFKEFLERKNFEAVAYSIYFALKYDFSITNVNADNSPIDSLKNDCISLLLLYLYCEKNSILSLSKDLKQYALELYNNERDDFWLFTYEVLSKDLKDDWKRIKNKKISFIKEKFLYGKQCKSNAHVA